jgi:hypothetical protein
MSWRSGTEDRGWNLLEASSRGEYGSQDAYRRLMSEADWSDFTWELLDNGVCDDGLCSFVLHLPNGRDSAPTSPGATNRAIPGCSPRRRMRPTQVKPSLTSFSEDGSAGSA